MSKVVCTVRATEAERKAVTEVLSDIAWISDGPQPDATAMLSLYPRAEMRKFDFSWTDLPRLEVVKLITAGANHAGWSTLPKQLRLAVTPGEMSSEIAEHVLAFILGWARNIYPTTTDIAAGKFEVGRPIRSLKGLNVGLIGFGAIGKESAKLLAAMGCNVRAVSRTGQGKTDDVVSLETIEGLSAMARQSQVLVCCLPLVRDTYGLVDEDLLASLPADALVVNVARGPVIDQEALWNWAYADQDNRAVALDVYWDYPSEGHPYDYPFHELRQVQLTPHNSPNIPDHRLRMMVAAAKQLRHYLETGELLNEQKPEWYQLPTDGDGR